MNEYEKEINFRFFSSFTTNIKIHISETFTWNHKLLEVMPILKLIKDENQS